LPHYYQNELHILDQIKGTNETTRDDQQQNVKVQTIRDMPDAKNENLTSGQTLQAKRAKTTHRLRKFTFKSGKETPLDK
jgi:hypothetical protein